MLVIIPSLLLPFPLLSEVVWERIDSIIPLAEFCHQQAVNDMETIVFSLGGVFKGGNRK